MLTNHFFYFSSEQGAAGSLLRTFWRVACVASFAISVVFFTACNFSSPPPPATPPIPAAAPLPADAGNDDGAIRFLEGRVKSDPLDFVAYNQLAGRYLQRQRETGSVTYLDLAIRAARASLAAIPAEQNVAGLSALAYSEYASHDFAAARDQALRLTELDAGKSYPYELLSDALMELGDYDKARDALHRAEQMGRTLETETRLARWALLQGQPDTATRRFANALIIALNQYPPSRETVAWCRWQLGETAFSIGDYETAERHYRDALTTFPNYYRALASLGRVRAARGDLSGAIEQYQQAIKILPDPGFVAALGDLYTLSGRDKEAADNYALVEQIGKLSALNGVLYNRQLAIFYADHDLKANEAYDSAKKEYEMRQDIYGADAVAWTALKAGKIAEAQAAIKDALQLGTRDAKLYYHAGMIARAAGDKAAAKDYLKKVLALNPQFDPMQAAIARKAIE